MRDEQGFDPDENYTVEDNPFWDGTEGAHPAWWRGQQHTVEMMDKYYHTLKSLDKLVNETSIYPDKGDNFNYTVVGLAGEAGELNNKWKKVLRGDREFDDAAKKYFAKELGDVLWYLTACAYELGYPLDKIATMTVDKLLGRRERGTLQGDGDDR